MASRLTALWVGGLVVSAGAVAAVLLPPGALVRRADAWVSTLLNERPQTTEREQADRVVAEAREALQSYARWEESDSVRAAVEVARRDGRRALGSFFGAPGEERGPGWVDPLIARALDQCVVRALTLGGVSAGTLTPVSCATRRGPGDVWSLRVEEAAWVEVNLRSEAFDTYLYLTDHTGASLENDDDGGEGSNSRIGRILEPGRYHLVVSAYRAGATGPYEISASEVPVSGALRVAAGDSITVPAVGGVFEVGLDTGRDHVVWGPGGHLASGGASRTLRPTEVVRASPPGRTIVAVPAAARSTTLSVSPPLPTRGIELPTSGRLADTLRPDRLVAAYELRVPDRRVLALALEAPAEPGEVVAVEMFHVPPDGEGARLPPGQESQMRAEPGLHRIFLVRAQSALPATRPVEIVVRCVAAVVPARIGDTNPWRGPEECRDGEPRAQWVLSVEAETVVDLEWEGPGSVAVDVGVSRSFGARTVFPAGEHRVLAERGAAEGLRVVSLGAPAPFLESLVAERVAELRRRGDVMVGVMATEGTFPVRGLSFDVFWEPFERDRVTYAGRDGDGWCVEVHHPFQRERVLTQWGPESLGGCRLFARYGLPGDEVWRWLGAGGIDFGVRPAEAGVVPPFRDRGSFGAIGRAEFAADTEACLEGSLERCDRIWTFPRGPSPERVDPALYHGQVSWAGVAYGAEATLLADLELEFGQEAFERFWSSSRPVSEAFAEAFGTAPATWLRDWARERLGTRTARGSTTLDGVFSLLFVLALAGVAAHVGARRAVG